MSWRFLLLTILALTLGFAGATFVNRSHNEKKKNELHSRLATLRTYEEGHALRSGFYVLLPNSCLKPGDPGWKLLGMPAPDRKDGCFRVESDHPYPGGTSAPTMRIVAQSPVLGIEAVEGESDSKPTWRPYKP